MAIPKHLKKQLKQDFRRSPEKKVGRSRTWSYAVGDLVKLKKADSWGLIVGKIGSYYSVALKEFSLLLLRRQARKILNNTALVRVIFVLK